MSDTVPVRHRCAAVVGPYSAGKTTLLEALLHTAGCLARKGSVAAGSSVGDAAPEARARHMTIDANIVDCTYLGDRWTLIDAPGSVELTQEAVACLSVADIAILVAEPDPARAATLAPFLHALAARRIPHILFVAKMDKATASIRDLLAALQRFSERPLVLREIPIREGEAVTGHVDLVSERAWRWRENRTSDLVAMPESVIDPESSARQEMLEHLADFDDALLEQLLEDHIPAPAEIYAKLAHDMREDLIVPVFFGSGEHGHGVTRLWKALRHEAPEVAATAARLGVAAEPGLAATVFKTQHLPHTGKLSVARLWSGRLTEGATLGGQRIAGLYRLSGTELQRAAEAGPGTVVGIGRFDAAQTGTLIRADGRTLPMPSWPASPPPVHAIAIAPADRKDEVKMTAALAKLIEEDGALSLEHDARIGQIVLYGQGEIHLQIAVERLRQRFNVAVTTAAPRTAYRETIRHGTKHHARFKRQTGGHGQFADIHVEISPLERGAGFAFENRVIGGAVPKNYIPAVEAGVREALHRGALGFEVIDIAVALTDGQYHAVDSSDQAFRTVAQMAMTEALPSCGPMLLEPVHAVTFFAPTEFTAKVHAIISGRRAQFLGVAARDGWSGWDETRCLMPQSEMRGVIVDLRSATLGIGSFIHAFDHLQEITGRLADQIVEDRRRALAA
jgi:elongation factor G